MKRLTLLLAIFLLGSTLTDGKDFRHWKRLQIKSVVPDYEDEKLYIYGLYFGDSPVAWLNDGLLDIEVANDNFIEAILPTIEPGTYRLLVARRTSKHPHPRKMDIIDVALGPPGEGLPQNCNQGEIATFNASTQTWDCTPALGPLTCETFSRIFQAGFADAVSCPAGMVMTGGSISYNHNNLTRLVSKPLGNGWYCDLQGLGSGSGTCYVRCCSN